MIGEYDSGNLKAIFKGDRVTEMLSKTELR